MWIKWHHRLNGLKRHYKTLYPNAAEYTFSSTAQGTFSKIDQILEQKASLKRKPKIILSFCLMTAEWDYKTIARETPEHIQTMETEEHFTEWQLDPWKRVKGNKSS